VNKYDVERLEEELIAKNYANNIYEAIATVESSKHNHNINDSWSFLKDGIERVAESIVGRKEPERRQPWFDEECDKTTQDKNRTYWLMQQKRRTRGVEEEYKRLRKAEKHIHQKKKREHYVEKLKEVEALGENGKSRMFYRKMSNTRNNFKPRNTLCRHKNGNLITEEG
jgi:hypothetical protein